MVSQVNKPSSAEDSLAGVSAANAVDSLHGVSAAVRRAKQVRFRGAVHPHPPVITARAKTRPGQRIRSAGNMRRIYSTKFWGKLGPNSLVQGRDPRICRKLGLR